MMGLILGLYLPIWFSVCLSICLSAYLPIFQTVNLSICSYIHCRIVKTCLWFHKHHFWSQCGSSKHAGKRAGKRIFWRDVSAMRSQLGLRLVDASQGQGPHQSEFRSAPIPDFWLLISQSTSTGTQCPYPGSQSEAELTPHGRNIPPEISLACSLLSKQPFKLLKLLTSFLLAKTMDQMSAKSFICYLNFHQR